MKKQDNKHYVLYQHPVLLNLCHYQGIRTYKIHTVYLLLHIKASLYI